MAAYRAVLPISEAWRHGASDRAAVIGLFGYNAPTLPEPIPDSRLDAFRARSRFARDPWLDTHRVARLRLGPLPALRVPPNRESRPIVELRAAFSHLSRTELAGERLPRFHERHFPQRPSAPRQRGP